MSSESSTSGSESSGGSRSQPHPAIQTAGKDKPASTSSGAPPPTPPEKASVVPLRSTTSTRRLRIAGVVLLASLVLHLIVNVPAGELLWTCYIATVVLGVSLITRWSFGIGAGFVFHAGVGFPGYFLDLFTGASTGTGDPLSIVVHVLAPFVGGWAAFRIGLARRAWVGAWSLYALMTLLSVFFTNPALNVNLAHQPWEPVARHFPSIWVYRAGNLALAVCTLFAADAVFRRLFRKRAATAVAA